MPRKKQHRTPGLRWRNEVWHIEKRTRFAPSGWIRESTGTSDRSEAERYLIRRLADLEREAQQLDAGHHTFDEAGRRYLSEIVSLSSAEDVALHLSQLLPFIGSLRLEEVHDGTLTEFIRHELERGLAPKSVNNAIGVVSAVLNRAAKVWRDERGRPWLRQAPPRLTRLALRGHRRRPYSLTWDEQDKLIRELPRHLQDMALFKVNTGCREQEVCQLQWDWEIAIPDASLSVFVIPAYVGGKQLVKNGEDRLVVLNQVAQNVVDARRGTGGRYVFTYRGNPVGKMNNTAWKAAWKAAGLPVSRELSRGVHNLKHTLGRRLRAVGCPEETRRDLLGHKGGSITTHYSAAELLELRGWLDRQAERSTVSTPTLTAICRTTVGWKKNAP